MVLNSSVSNQGPPDRLPPESETYESSEHNSPGRLPAYQPHWTPLSTPFFHPLQQLYLLAPEHRRQR